MSDPAKKHICYVCTNPPGVRESARYSYDQDWLREGRMAEFSCLEPEPNCAAKAKIMRATHDLVADLQNVRQVMDSVSRKIFVVQHLVEPEFGLWAQDLDDLVHNETEETHRQEMSKNDCVHYNKTDASQQLAVDPTTPGCVVTALSTVACNGDLHATNNYNVGIAPPPASVTLSASNVLVTATGSADNGNTLPVSEAMQRSTSANTGGGNGAFCTVTDNSSTVTDNGCCKPDFNSVAAPSQMQQHTSPEPSQSDLDIQQATSHPDLCLDHPLNPLPIEVGELTVTEAQLLGTCTLPGDGQAVVEGINHVSSSTVGDDLKPLSSCLDVSGAVATGQHTLVSNTTYGQAQGSCSEPSLTGDGQLLAVDQENQNREMMLQEQSPTEPDSSSICEKNLLRHISRMQDELDRRLAIIEEQVNALENGEGNRAASGDSLHDMLRVKKTLRQLINDLENITRMSQMNQ
jgi:hypothetical protein